MNLNFTSLKSVTSAWQEKTISKAKDIQNRVVVYAQSLSSNQKITVLYIAISACSIMALSRGADSVKNSFDLYHSNNNIALQNTKIQDFVSLKLKYKVESDKIEQFDMATEAIENIINKEKKSIKNTQVYLVLNLISIPSFLGLIIYLNMQLKKMKNKPDENE
jgi:hypothetical protein